MGRGESPTAVSPPNPRGTVDEQTKIPQMLATNPPVEPASRSTTVGDEAPRSARKLLRCWRQSAEAGDGPGNSHGEALTFPAANSGQVLSQPVNGGDQTVQQPAGVYIVHVRKPAHMLSASSEEVEEWHKSFLPTHTLLDSGEPRMLFSYKAVISGFAARLTAGEVKAMETKEGFLYAQPDDEEITPETTHTPDFLGLRPNVWRAANRGRGSIIGVVDSGIDHDHDSFQANPIPDPPGWGGWCYFDDRRTCNGKLIGAAYARVPPVDNTGHGTHVAGIASGVEVRRASIHGHALGTASGAAPDAYLAMYGAPNGSAAEILNAFDQAIQDGVHLITISMGRSSTPFYGCSIAKAALSAIRNGIMVSASAGNRGPGWCTVGNVAPWILTVGASTMGRVLRWNLTVKNGVGDDLAIPGESVHVRPVAGEIVYPGANGGGDNLRECTDLTGGVDAVDKVVMCYTREKVQPKYQAEAVRRAGGVAMVLMNAAVRGSIVTGIPNLGVLPVVTINHGDSLLLIDHVGVAGNRSVQVEILPVGTLTGVAPFPAVPYFSSRGPSPNNGGVLKPDILGPGVNVLAARLNSRTGFTLKSGTSMATPHLAGVAAILKQHLPRAHTGINWTPAMIRSAIITTAQSSNRQGDPITDETDQPADMMAVGAGHVDPAAAMDPGLVFDISFDDYIRYLCGLGYNDRQVEITSGIQDANCGDPRRKIDPAQLNYPSISVTLNSSSVPAKTVERTATHVTSGPSTYRAEVTLDRDNAGDPNAADPVLVVVDPDTLHFAAGPGERRTFEVTFTLPAPVVVADQRYITGKLRWVSATHTVTIPLHIAIGESQAAVYGC